MNEAAVAAEAAGPADPRAWTIAGAPFRTVWLGLREYAEVWALQKRHVERRLRGEVEDALFLVEHPTVITLGRGGRREALGEPPAPVFEVERGGAATLHAPGQLVGYPIFLLPAGRRDARRFLRDVEESLLRALAALGIAGSRREGWTGVWVGERKVASLGVAIRRWVTYHGFALNVSTDLALFRMIRPCGLPAEVMTTVEAVLGRKVPVAAVADATARSFAEVFG